MRMLVAGACALLLLGSTAAQAQVLAGMALFEQHCGRCHSTPSAGSRAPDRLALSQRTPESVLEAMTTGSMRVNAQALSEAQKRVVAEHLTLRPLGSSASGDAASMTNACAADLAPPTSSTKWSGWGVDAGNSRPPARRAPGPGMTPPMPATGKPRRNRD